MNAIKVKFQGDYDLNRAIITGVKRLRPEIDFQNADQSNLRGVLDEEVLAIAARDGRILVSHDHNTMPIHFASFISNHVSPGLLLVAQTLPIRDAIEELQLIWEASEAEEWKNRIEFIPL